MTKPGQWLTLVLLCFCTAEIAVMAQQNARPNRFNPRFEVFKLPGGETANMVQCIIQDKTGFLWFATRAGLIRYDGRQFVTYRHDPSDSSSIAADYVNWIFEDSKGILWLGSCCDGLSAFDPVTEKCVRYRHDDNDPSSLAADYVSAITEDRPGNIWIATAGGLDCFSPGPGRRLRGKIKHYLLDPGNRNLHKPFVRALYVDSRGILWVGCGDPYNEHSRGGLYRYQPETDDFIRMDKEGEPVDNRVQVLFEDRRKNFRIGTCGGAGLYRMETAGGRERFNRLPPFNNFSPTRLSSPALVRNDHVFPQYEHITFMFEDQQGRLWIGAVEGGLNVYDPSAGVTRHFEQASGIPDSLQSISLWHGCQGRDGTVWIGCGDNGPVYRVTNTNDIFPFYHTRHLFGMEEINITGMLKEPTGAVWLQTLGDMNSVVRFDRAAHTYRRFDYDPPAIRHSYLDLFALAGDQDGNLWASTEQGLYRQEPATAGHGTFRPDPVFSDKLQLRAAWPPFRDPHGNTWVATFGQGLFRVKAGSDTAVPFRHNPADTTSIGGNLVEKVFEDRQGNIWVLGASAGFDRRTPMFLDRFNPGDQTFTHFLPPGELGDPGSVVKDHKGNFWFTAFPFGIRKFNPDTPKYEAFTVGKSALPTNMVMEMQAGNDGNIWMLAKDGIIKLNPETGSFFTYTAYHGIQTYPNDRPWITGSCTGPDGEILFGSYGGFYAFYPGEIQHAAARSPAQTYITGLTVLGKRTVPGKEAFLSRPVWESPVLKLSHDHNVFAFHISSFEFGDPALSRLEFKLENYDRAWRSDLRGGEASYVNVPPGKYTFRVRGTNSMGIRMQETALPVIVLPPWWQSWWAYAFYIFTLAGGLYAFYRFQLKQKLEHAEALRLQELDKVKTKLYTNITHEFRTPLTLLIGPAERLLQEKPLDEETRGVLKTVQRNARRLLQLVNQMLDLSKLESGNMRLYPVQGDIVAYLKYIVESFHSSAENKKIKMHFLTGLDSLTMDFDEEKMQQVLSNLLSNALKFTPEGGNVYIDLRLNGPYSADTKVTPNTMSILVRDTGIGIPEEQLPRIFDRFYQGAPGEAAGGTGIGLSLANELVKLMGGRIGVKSRPDWGTEFEVALPVMRSESAREISQWPNRENNSSPAGPETGSLEAAASAGQQVHSETTPLVLLVEDNPDVIAYLASCLPDYRLAMAKDGREGLDIATETVPDIVVSDVMMPRMDGLELCRTLKNDLRTSHIPVVLLTAKADMASKLEGLEQGADAYLAKPFHREELQLRVRKLLEGRHLMQQHYLSAAGLTDGAVIQKDIPSLSGFEDAFVKKIRAAVEEHLDDPQFDVDKLCRGIAMSHSQVHRKLTALTGLSATRFIRYVRLNKAKSLLQNPALSITAVAFDSGFNDPAYFSRVFKQEFGLTPQAWREQSISP